jgi:hypothetical protein
VSVPPGWRRRQHSTKRSPYTDAGRGSRMSVLQNLKSRKAKPRTVTVTDAGAMRCGSYVYSASRYKHSAKRTPLTVAEGGGRTAA